MLFAHDEPCAQDDTSANPDPRVAGQRSRQGSEAVCDGAERARQQRGSRTIELRARSWVLALRDVTEGHGDDERRYRQVDPEHPSPVPELDEPPTEERPDGSCGAGETGPGADRSSAVVLDERRLEDRQGRRSEQGPADSLSGPSRDENREGRRQTAQRGRRREYQHADDEDPSTAEPVTEGTAEEDQSGRGQRVRIDDPGESRRSHAEVGSDVREGDVDHGGVDEREGGPEHRRPDDPPSTGVLPGDADCPYIAHAVIVAPVGSPRGRLDLRHERERVHQLILQTSRKRSWRRAALTAL